LFVTLTVARKLLTRNYATRQFGATASQ